MSYLEQARAMRWWCPVCEHMHVIGAHDPGKNWPPEQPAPPQQPGGPFEFFGRKIYRLPCPECGKPTAVAFKDDGPLPLPGPTRCCECRAAQIAASAAALGVTIKDGTISTKTGPCARCRRPCCRYGEHGQPLCASCQDRPA